MTSTKIQNVRTGVAAPPSLREDAARGDTPFQPPSAPSLSHRWTNDPDGEAYCLDCWQTWRPDAVATPCDTERRICESCRQHPSSIWLYGFAVCGPCASAGVNP